MIMAKEGRLCKRYRQDWPGFLRRTVPDTIWQELNRHVPRCTDARVRWSPKYVVLCWVAMGWSLQRQLSERFREGNELLSALFPRRRRCGETSPGLAAATRRIGCDLLHHFWTRLRTTIPQCVGGRWTWHGWTVVAVDGSRIDAPRTRRNEAALGACGLKTHPQWWVTWITHLPTRLIWDWRQGPCNSSERVHLQQMLGTLPPSALLVADAGFVGFDLFCNLLRAGADFLVRCGGNVTLLVEGTTQHLERSTCGTYVYLWPTQRRQERPLRLRLIVLKNKGKRVYLLTNVLESTRLSRSVAGELYRARWGIEIDYRGLKQTLDRRKVLAKTPEAGAMELAANILAMALLMLQGAVAMGARVVRLSVAQALRTIRLAIERLRGRRRMKPFAAQLRRALRDTYERRRSKRARDWPHKKNESPPGPPILRSLSRLEKERIQTLEASQRATAA